ncbi:MAG TPA: 2-dehydropantoate 2-reductase [bacterium]
MFIARGENETAIRANGLTLITSQGQQIIYPAMVTSTPAQLHDLDLIICSVKSYDLETSMESLKPCTNDKTIVLPMLNGLDASERIKKLLPNAEVWQGCAYIISRLIAPAVVKESGKINRLYFGAEQRRKENLQRVEVLFKAAGINARLSTNILQTLWEKFLFISPLATLTSYLDVSVGEILSNQQHKKLLSNLLAEIKSLADARNITLSESIIQTTLDKISSLPCEATSSMHSDFKKGGKTEVDSLTGYVVELGKELNVPTPDYEKMLFGLTEKSLKRVVGL